MHLRWSFFDMGKKNMKIASLLLLMLASLRFQERKIEIAANV